MSHAESSFELTTVDEESPFIDDAGVLYARMHIAKTFTGDLDGTSTVEMLSVRSPVDGAGYVAIEHINATLAGRSGSFALLHAGTMVGGEFWAEWPVVPGSGTGGLAGISGRARIEIDADGSHTLLVDFELP